MAATGDPSAGGSKAATRAGRGVMRRLIDGVLFLASVAILAGWAWQGVFELAPGESAVILRLGAYDRTQSREGLGVHLPPPLESHVIVNSGQKRTESFGDVPDPMKTAESTEGDGERAPVGMNRDAIQTADHNVLHVVYKLQYRIADGYAWAFSMAEPTAVLRHATEAAMLEVIGRRGADSILSQGQSEILREAKALLGDLLAAYAEAGGHAAAFSVDEINLEPIEPPDAVREAFADVVSAGQDERRSAATAQGDAVEILERARSEAAAIREQAEAYRASRIVQAKGDAARFESLLVEYQAAPEVTRRRLYLETMESILPRMEKAIVDPDAVHLWSSWPPSKAPSPAATPAASPAATPAASPAASPAPSRAPSPAESKDETKATDATASEQGETAR